MQINAFTILILVALVLAIASLVKETWQPRLGPVALVFVCVALMIGRS